ncbi:type IV toxin-antitoxin system AbiEi family antitoxin domain-containing protein [Microbacterium sp. As-52]|uniref:type IV toxin-antitoxin system AbiEi family antitoxin domain-containing protein n=1 Tax=Microbacterium sp. As-52 TaxID=3390503 RepID=UPI003CF420F9
MKIERMRKAVTIEEARQLLLSRRDVLARGITERELKGMVDGGVLIRVRRGWYAEGEAWAQLWAEGRHLLKVLAVHRESSGGGAAFCFDSAAVLHGLPLYRTFPAHVHVLLGRTSHSRVKGCVARHDIQVGEGDLEEIEGIRCTSLERTVLDLTSRLGPEAAISVADAALRRVAMRGNEQDSEVAATWRGELARRARAMSGRGIRQARAMIALSDGRAQLPGESVSRLHLHRLGFTGIELQSHVTGPGGEDYWLDFAFRGLQAFGEFDGRGKYLDPDLRGERSAEDIVIAEKCREDAVRGVTGWRVVRWGYEHIVTPEALGARLGAFGLRP